jgi:peptidyl-prolyl cis-trans isomerase C
MSKRAPAALAAAAALAAFVWPAFAQTTKAPAPDPVVAMVNGDEIRLSEVRAAQGQLPEQYRDAPLELIFQPLVDQMIDRKLAAAEARKQKVQDDPLVRRQLVAAEDSVLQSALWNRMIEDALTDEKVRARYDSEIASAAGQEEVHARHILVKTEAEARDVKAALEKGGDFAKLAGEKSIDPTPGGDLGFFPRGVMVPEFTEAAFKLQPGEISEPVQSQFGWHVIRLEAKRDGGPPSFEESAEELRMGMARELVGAERQRLRGAAEVKTFNPDGTPQSRPNPHIAPGGQLAK